jgi:cellulose synthase/poly-beta-1,6-N-acetylglucosamine synthase-like glycosyltransferase
MDNPLASVIIPTPNRPQVVANWLDAMAAQTMPSDSFEAIVVDSGSEPALALDPTRWAPKFALKSVHKKTPAQRERAIAAAPRRAGNSLLSPTTTSYPRRHGSKTSSPPCR